MTFYKGTSLFSTHPNIYYAKNDNQTGFILSDNPSYSLLSGNPDYCYPISSSRGIILLNRHSKSNLTSPKTAFGDILVLDSKQVLEYNVLNAYYSRTLIFGNIQSLLATLAFIDLEKFKSSFSPTSHKR